MAKAPARQKDVVDLLVEQHKEIKELFTRVANARGMQKRALFDNLVRLLAVHETAEEEVVHPMARREIANGDRVVNARLREEGRAKRDLAELYDLGVDHVDFDKKLAALSESVIEHADREEKEEFPQLRRRISADQLRKMAGAVRTAQAAAPTRPHPMIGESAMANLLAGPPLAMIDRIQDAVRGWRESGRRR
ncbi:hemerythrin domain-containing protein [Actinopolymorpha alba]|uniref:hemerythrin domain-containing protein n=1 Tax=Actinopolymorpha alba TaxID=533267 RepID=UPI0003697829|nr:hemerythrin domain-containing protein [Actinopolymorpha alba]